MAIVKTANLTRELQYTDALRVKNEASNESVLIKEFKLNKSAIASDDFYLQLSFEDGTIQQFRYQDVLDATYNEDGTFNIRWSDADLNSELELLTFQPKELVISEEFETPMLDAVPEAAKMNAPDNWDEIEEEHQERLLDFYNTVATAIESDDLKILADLYHGETGSIHFSECDECGDHLCYAQPSDWDNFQGTSCSNEESCLNECCQQSLMSDM